MKVGAADDAVIGFHGGNQTNQTGTPPTTECFRGRVSSKRLQGGPSGNTAINVMSTKHSVQPVHVTLNLHKKGENGHRGQSHPVS